MVVVDRLTADAPAERRLDSLEMAYRFGWTTFVTDWHEVVDDPTIDIIDINTPNDTHAEIAMAAAKAGKAILCEKPLALDVKQAQAMVAAVQTAAYLRAAEQERMREELEAHLRQSQKMEAVGMLAGGIAHDFNNILSGVLGFASYLMSKTTPGPSAWPSSRRSSTIPSAARCCARAP